MTWYAIPHTDERIWLRGSRRLQPVELPRVVSRIELIEAEQKKPRPKPKKVEKPEPQYDDEPQGWS